MKKLLVISTTFVLFVAMLFYALGIEEKTHRESAQKWREFSSLHHCHVGAPQTVWGASTTWQCDGFQVIRRNDE